MVDPDAKRDNALEIFRRVSAVIVRALARRENLSVEFHAGEADSEGTTVHLSSPSFPLDEAQVARVRGQADAVALRLRYHDERIHSRYLPANPTACAVYNALEQARVDARGIRYMRGVAQNLATRLEQQCRNQGYANAHTKQDVQLADAVHFIVRQALTGEAPPPSARAMIALWRSWLHA